MTMEPCSIRLLNQVCLREEGRRMGYSTPSVAEDEAGQFRIAWHGLERWGETLY